MAARRKKKQRADFRDQVYNEIVGLAVGDFRLVFIKADEEPHEATRKDHGLGFSHVDFFLSHNQGVGQNKCNQRNVTHPHGG